MFFNTHSSQAAILYYARERQYRHVYAEVLQLMQRHGAAPVLVFWKAYSTSCTEQQYRRAFTDALFLHKLEDNVELTGDKQ